MWLREKTSTKMATGPCGEATWGAGRAGCISNERIQLLHRDRDRFPKPPTRSLFCRSLTSHC